MSASAATPSYLHKYPIQVRGIAPTNIPRTIEGRPILTMPHSDHSASPTWDAFPDLPPFSKSVPTAPLLRISLSKLLAHDPDEEERCWKACCDLGFFYLDLHTSDASQEIDGGALLHNAEELFEVMKGFFELPVEEKTTYDFADKGSYFGYKGYGKGIVDKKGTKDRNEFYNVV